MTSGLLGPPQGRLPSLVDRRASPRLLTAHIDDVGDVRRRFSVHPRTALAEHPTKRLHGFAQTIGKPPHTKIRDHDVVNHLLEERLRGDLAEPFSNDALHRPRTLHPQIPQILHPRIPRYSSRRRLKTSRGYRKTGRRLIQS